MSPNLLVMFIFGRPQLARLNKLENCASYLRPKQLEPLRSQGGSNALHLRETSQKKRAEDCVLLPPRIVPLSLPASSGLSLEVDPHANLPLAGARELEQPLR